MPSPIHTLHLDSDVLDDFIYKDHECQIRKNRMLAILCGYVQLNESLDQHFIDSLEVHGGITFESDTEPKVIGFDCAHCDDYIPGFVRFSQHERLIHWDQSMVKTEIKLLVDQLVDLSNYHKWKVKHGLE